MKIRNCIVDDISEVRQFLSRNKPLGCHSCATYWVLFTYFNNSYFVAEENGKVIGFTGGLKSTSQKDVFHLWQIGVDKEHRSMGYAKKLLYTVIKEAIKMKCLKLQISMVPENVASFTLFTKFVNKHNIKIVRLSLIDYYDSLSNFKENEILYEIDISKITLSPNF
jgi:L-2,4-diaminobutyric acid acetyltransferase